MKKTKYFLSSVVEGTDNHEIMVNRFLENNPTITILDTIVTMQYNPGRGGMYIATMLFYVEVEVTPIGLLP